MTACKWSGLASDSTSPALAPFVQTMNQWSDWHAYVSGTLGGATVQIQISPDTTDTPDDASVWLAPADLQFSAPGGGFFQAEFKKARAVVSGGDGTTAITVEIV